MESKIQNKPSNIEFKKLEKDLDKKLDKIRREADTQQQTHGIAINDLGKRIGDEVTRFKRSLREVLESQKVITDKVVTRIE